MSSWTNEVKAFGRISETGSQELSRRSLFEYLVVECEVSDGPLQPFVLSFEPLEAPCLVDPQHPVLGSPPVEGLLCNLDLVAGRLNRARSRVNRTAQYGG